MAVESRIGLNSIERRVTKAKESITHARLLTPPPLSPLGYRLQLANNIPSQLTPAEDADAKQKIEDLRKKLTRRHAFYDTLKVNITDLSIVNSKDSQGRPDQVIQYTTAPAYYLQHRAGIDRHTPYETARKLSHAGVSIIVITGDNRIVLSSRPENVQLYPRTYASTASGSWDGTMQPSQPGQPNVLVPPTPENALSHVKDELHEELYLPRNVINSPESRFTVLGVAEDEVKKHRDILYMMRLPKEVTAAQLRTYLNEGKQNGYNDHPNDPMAGHLMSIPASSRDVKYVLTHTKAPWDATAKQALILTGYMLKMEEMLAKGNSQEIAVEKAKHWMQNIEWRNGLSQVTHVDRLARRMRRKKIRKAAIQLIKAKIHSPFKMSEAQNVALYDLKKYWERPRGYDVHRTPARQGLREVKKDIQKMGFQGDDLPERTRRRAN